MPNYQDGKIYKIVCNITDECYIGSTCEPRLARRLAKHVSDFKSWKEGKRHKISSFDIIENGNYQILLIETYPCNSKDELTAREGEVIRQSKLDCQCVNRYIAGRSHKQYCNDNKEVLIQRKQVYRAINKEVIRSKRAEKITCSCGSSFGKYEKSRHERSNKHQDYLKPIQ